jgi:protein-tyrosine phosphatase
MTAIPYIDSYWVIPDKFLAGAYPGGPDEETTRKKVQSLINAGIDCVVDLTQPGDAFTTYAKTLTTEAADFGIEVERVSFPIPDYDIPTIALMKKVLDCIDDHLALGKRVYVHCIGGIGRTGTVVACHLVRHGLSGQEALVQLQVLRQQSASWYRRSPESDLQIEFVLHWENNESRE